LGILWFSSRLRLEPGRFWRWFLPHFGLCAAFSVSNVAIVSWLWAGQISVQTGEPLQFGSLFQKLAFTYTLHNILLYWVLVMGHLGWQYYLRYRERERDAAALATELVQARLQALRMQLNPHFLFNSLNTILSLIHEKPEAADRMLVRLSQLLRRTLDHSETHEVPLREELQFLKIYLEIEQMRFSDRLTVTYHVPPETEDLFVPQLILQPLVENALRHGILPREQAGRLELEARTENGMLKLTVRDDGIGLPAGADFPLADGVGLKNVRSRLGHLYGSEQRFELREAPGGGVEAVVSIPCCTVPGSRIPRVLIRSGPEAGGQLVPLRVDAKPTCC
jgi:sensor histidine kinase YesM